MTITPCYEPKSFFQKMVIHNVVYICRMAYKQCKNDLPKCSHEAEEDSCSVEGKENSMAYIPAFDRRMRIGLTNGSNRHC